MITGIVLAGGKSTRVGQNKLFLDLNGKPLICHTIDSIRPFVDKIILVTGKYHDDFANYFDDVELVHNENYELGMFSSILCGVKKAEGNFFIIPGDCPFVSSNTYKALLCNDSFSLRVPTYDGRHGHPIYVHALLKPLLLQEDINSNLKLFRDRVGFEQIDVNDINVLNDIDTLENYIEVKGHSYEC